MTGFGRKLPFAGIANAIDFVTATKGWNRPNKSFSLVASNVRFRITKLTLPTKSSLCAAVIGSIVRFFLY